MGQMERDRLNNHGTWYDAQIAAYALFTGRDKVARRVLQEAAEKRIARQIEPDGRQPHELARTKSFSYSVMNLRGMFTLAALVLLIPTGWHLMRNRGEGKPLRGPAVIAVLLLGGATLSYPYGRIPVARPALMAGELSEQQASALLETLLKNIYRAFDFREERDVYDKLALSVDGDLLAVHEDPGDTALARAPTVIVEGELDLGALRPDRVG